MQPSLLSMEKKPKNLIENELEIEMLASRLRAFRKKLGYKTAEDCALKIGMQRSQYTRYEAGTNLNYLSLVAVLRKMKIPLKEFFSEGFD